MPFHSYIFFDSEPSLQRLSKKTQRMLREKCIATIARNRNVRSHAYATLGLKAGTRFALHLNAATPDEIQIVVRDLLHTELGTHLRISYTLVGHTRHSQYNPHHPPQEADWDQPHRYLVVYPFTKTTEWHGMPYEIRRNIMKAHVDVGRRYSDAIAQQLLYSFGIDDHEFIVSYQMNDLTVFTQLVMDMRETESRRHTKNDLPIFTCIHMTLSEALDMI